MYGKPYGVLCGRRLAQKRAVALNHTPFNKNISGAFCTKWVKSCNIATRFSPAQVAELVDAADSKSAVRKDVLVRFQSWALPK